MRDGELAGVRLRLLRPSALHGGQQAMAVVWGDKVTDLVARMTFEPGEQKESELYKCYPAIIPFTC